VQIDPLETGVESVFNNICVGSERVLMASMNGVLWRVRECRNEKRNRKLSITRRKATATNRECEGEREREKELNAAEERERDRRRFWRLEMAFYTL
jgi:hypothetical protein